MAKKLLVKDDVNGFEVSTLTEESIARMELSSTVINGKVTSQNQVLPALPSGKRYYIASIRWFCVSGNATSHPAISIGSTSGGTDYLNGTLPSGTPAVNSLSGGVSPNPITSSNAVFVNITTIAGGGTTYTGRVWMLYYILNA